MNELRFENELAIVAIIKNESKYINEWLDYHYRIGVDKFYIYNNDSDDTDELEKILQPWIQHKIVDYTVYTGDYKQMPAYNNAIELHRFDCKYIAFIDLDEFIYLKTEQTLTEFLHEHFSKDPQISGLGINWRMFGTSGKQFYEPIDVIDRFTFRNKDDCSVNLQIKTIANPRRILFMNLPHNPIYMLGGDCYDSSLNFIRDFQSEKNDCSKIQLNHYYTKSVEEYNLKLAKGRADCNVERDKSAAYNPAMNEVEDLGLKNLYHQLKLKPLPQIKDHSEQMILKNVLKMIKTYSINSNAQIEKLLTCLFLTRKSSLLTTAEKIDFENIIMEFILKSMPSINLLEMSLMLVCIVDLMKSNSPLLKNIVNEYKKFLPYLETQYQNEVENHIAFHIHQILQLLQLM